MENRRTEEFLSEGLALWEGRGCGERGGYGANTGYAYIYVEK
jgi:hypothetical protein